MDLDFTGINQMFGTPTRDENGTFHWTVKSGDATVPFAQNDQPAAPVAPVADARKTITDLTAARPLQEALCLARVLEPLLSYATADDLLPAAEALNNLIAILKTKKTGKEVEKMGNKSNCKGGKCAGAKKGGKKCAK